MPVDSIVDEPDQLEDSPEEMYTPVFLLTYFENVLEKIKLEQRNDPEISEKVSSLNNSRLDNGTRPSDSKYVIKNEVLCRKILPFPKEKNSSTLDLKLAMKKTIVAEPKGDRSDSEIVIVPPVSEVNSSFSDLNGNRDINSVQEPVAADLGNGSTNSREIYDIVPVVPYSLRNEIMEYFHSYPEFGHFVKTMSKAFDDIRKFLKEKDGRPTEKFKLFTKEGHFNIFARVMLFRRNAAKLRDLNPNLVLLPKDVIWLCITKPCNIKMLEAVMPSLSDWQVICKQGLVDAIATGKSTTWDENLAHKNTVHYVTVDSWSDDDSDFEHDYDVYLPDTNVQERVYTPTTNAENDAQNNEQERAFNAPSTSTSCINNNDNSSEISTIDCQILNEYAINKLANDSDCNENITDDNMNDSGLCDMIMGSAHNEVENVNRNVEENDGIVIAIENEQVELANPINRNCEESIEIVPPMNENRFDRVVNFHDVREHDLMHHWKEIRTSKMWKPTINRLRRKRASIKRYRMEQLTLRCGEKNVGLWPY
ncbi:unnamed protein product [Orchesella dallaii]